MKLTYYGHSAFLLETLGSNVLFDPFISPNPKASDIDIDSIPADFILISHGHGDHVADVAAIGKRTGAKLVSNYEIIGWFEQQGLKNGHGLNHGGSVVLPFGVVKYVNAIHSSTLPDGSNGGNPGGFVIENEEGTLYFAGDTALSMDMQLLGRYMDIDHALLPIGDNFTMGIDDAIIAADFVNCKDVIGMHYNTFPPIEIDEEEARSKFEAAGLNLRLLKIGETVEL